MYWELMVLMFVVSLFGYRVLAKIWLFVDNSSFITPQIHRRVMFSLLGLWSFFICLFFWKANTTWQTCLYTHDSSCKVLILDDFGHNLQRTEEIDHIRIDLKVAREEETRLKNDKWDGSNNWAEQHATVQRLEKELEDWEKTPTYLYADIVVGVCLLFALGTVFYWLTR